MPEGNEIHRWAERHQAAFAGKVVRADGPQGRFTDVVAIDGRKLLRVMAVGKHLGYVFGKDRIVHVHLGLRGDFTDGTGPLPEVKGALRWRMWNQAAVKLPVADGESRRHAWYADDDGSNDIDANKMAWMELRGPTDCSIWTDAKWDLLRERLGPDPLGVDGRGGDDPCEGVCEDTEEQEGGWRAADGPVGDCRDWEHLQGGAALPSEVESVCSGEGCSRKRS